MLLITADDGRSYSKPMLSTGFGKNKDADGLSMAEPGAMAEQLKAEVRTHTRISGIDPGHKRLWIGEEAVIYRDLILAWGAETVRVPIEGDASDCVFPINDLEDYARFRAAAAGKRRVLLLGAGLIGCEFANDLSLGGYEVQLVAPCEQVMPTLLHPAAAAAVQAGLESLGARFHLGPVLNRLQRVADGLEAHLSDGQVIPCDVVVSAIGLRPRIDMAAAAGVQVNRGVVVDRHLKTSHASIYALGDCAGGRWPEFAVRHAADELCESAGSDLGRKRYASELRPDADHCENPGVSVGGITATTGQRGPLDGRGAGRRPQGVMPRCQRKTAGLCPDRRGRHGKTGPQQRASGTAGVNTGRSVGITPLLLKARAETGAAPPVRAILTPVCRRVEHPARRTGRLLHRERGTDHNQQKNRQRGFTNA